MSPQVLVVGAGSVGQVIGRHLQLGGASVTFLVRPKYRDAVSRGFELYPLGPWRRGPPVHWAAFDVVSSADEVSGRRFDQVFLTLSSAGLPGPWLPELAAAIGEATVVTLQPGPADRELILASGVAPRQLVSGLISFISYAAPLEGETRFPMPGTAYWLPPGSAMPFSGDPGRATEVAHTLSRGRLRATVHRDVPREVAFSNAILMPLMIALEQSGWSLRTVRSSGRLALAARAIREMIAIVARSHGRRPRLAPLASWPPLLGLLARVAPRLVPLPLEPYLRKHFTKVGAQTRLIAASTLAAGQRAGLPTGALAELSAGLPPLPRSERLPR